MKVLSTAKDDRADPYWAAATSFAMHICLLYCFLGTDDGLGAGGAARTNGPSLARGSSAQLEFRQPVQILQPPTPTSASPEEKNVRYELPELMARDMPQEEEPAQDEPSERMDQPIPAAYAQADAQRSSDSVAPIAPSQAGQQAGGDGMASHYLQALAAAIRGKWARSGEGIAQCSLLIVQTAGGNVVGASAEHCGLPEQERLALEAAALMAQPLPYAGYEDDFREQITLNF